MYERLQEILRLLEDPSGLEDHELAEYETELMQIFDDLLGEERSAESVQAMTDVADSVDGLRFVSGERLEAARVEAEAEAAREAQEAEAVAALERRIRAAEGEGEEGEGEGDDAGDGAVDEAAAEGDEPDAGDGTDDNNVDPVRAEGFTPDGEGDGGDEVHDDERELEPVGAGATTSADAPVVASTATRDQLRENQGRGHQPARVGARTRPRGRIRAAGMGGTYRDSVAVEDALLDRWFDLQGTGETGRRRVATFELAFPKERQFPEGRITDVDALAIDVRTQALQEPEALMADGGLCGPVDVYYGLQTISQASRPLRSAIANYQAKRGGISFMTPMKLSDIQTATTPTVGRAVGVVTEANDAASTYDKSFQTISCGTQVEKRVDAVYLQLEFGRFLERTNPERKSQFTDLSLAAFARFNEQRLFTAMAANSTAVDAPQKLGATRDLLNGLNRMAINYRSIHRMNQTATLDVVLPVWVGMGLLPDDQTNALQSYEQQFSVNSAWVEARLRERNLNVIWFEDDFTTALGAGGGINNYPSVFKALVFHPGAHVIVDQGDLNLGVLVDSVLAVSNTFRTFMEEFWTTAMWGVDSYAVSFSLCENGASAGSVEPSCGS